MTVMNTGSADKSEGNVFPLPSLGYRQGVNSLARQ